MIKHLQNALLGRSWSDIEQYFSTTESVKRVERKSAELSEAAFALRKMLESDSTLAIHPTRIGK